MPYRPGLNRQAEFTCISESHYLGIAFIHPKPFTSIAYKIDEIEGMVLVSVEKNRQFGYQNRRATTGSLCH